MTSVRAGSTSRVGVPTHETILTAAIVDRPDVVLSGRRSDHTMVVLEEVELGIGRPDLIVLTLDLAVVALRASAGLRLANLTEARALGSLLSGDPVSAGISLKHLRKVSDRLEDAGWLDPRRTEHAVSDSVVIEAKVSHWGKGVGQLVRVRWASHTAALLVPTDVAPYVPRTMLRSNGLGLLAQEREGVVWRKAPSRADLPIHIDAWLCELATRSLES